MYKPFYISEDYEYIIIHEDNNVEKIIIMRQQLKSPFIREICLFRSENIWRNIDDIT